SAKSMRPINGGIGLVPISVPGRKHNISGDEHRVSPEPGESGAFKVHRLNAGNERRRLPLRIVIRKSSQAFVLRFERESDRRRCGRRMECTQRLDRALGISAGHLVVVVVMYVEERLHLIIAVRRLAERPRICSVIGIGIDIDRRSWSEGLDLARRDPRLSGDKARPELLLSAAFTQKDEQASGLTLVKSQAKRHTK